MFIQIIRRTAQSVWVLLAVSALSFALFQFVGDPVTQMLGQDATEEARERLRQELGLDQPFWIQYWTYLSNVAQGDFGISLQQARPVIDLILERLPATLELAIFSLIIAVSFGVPFGIVTAIWPHHWISRAIMVFSLLGVSLPTFFIGVALIYVFSVALGWMPSFGRGPTTTIGGWVTSFGSLESVKYLILPAITLALFQLTLIVRLVRGEVMEVLAEDFIRFACARGLSWWSIYVRHAMRNALLPVITIIGLQLGVVIAFALITETVFQWPGLGLLFAQSVAFADVPVMAAYLTLVGLIFVIINFIVDLLYVAIDPRLR